MYSVDSFMPNFPCSILNFCVFSTSAIVASFCIDRCLSVRKRLTVWPNCIAMRFLSTTVKSGTANKIYRCHVCERSGIV
jgi:hypothetical protein